MSTESLDTGALALASVVGVPATKLQFGVA